MCAIACFGPHEFTIQQVHAGMAKSWTCINAGLPETVPYRICFQMKQEAGDAGDSGNTRTTDVGSEQPN